MRSLLCTQSVVVRIKCDSNIGAGVWHAVAHFRPEHPTLPRSLGKMMLRQGRESCHDDMTHKGVRKSGCEDAGGATCPKHRCSVRLGEPAVARAWGVFCCYWFVM